jgi:hypothetical protein
MPLLEAASADDTRFAEATNLIARYPEHPLRTLAALQLTIAAHLLKLGEFPWLRGFRVGHRG